MKLTHCLTEKVAGYALVVTTWIYFCVTTWDAWIEPLVDVGRELYVPWMLSSGQKLFLDIAYFNGPVSPWWNALFFHIFGSSTRTLTTVNLTLSLVFVLFLQHHLKQRFSSFTATLCNITLIALFIFPQLTRNNAFNYIAPYSHEMTHGIYLAMIALLLITSRPLHQLKPHTSGIIGCCAGLVFMLKPELFIATAAAITWTALTQWQSLKKIMKQMTWFLIGFGFPIVAAAAIISTYLPPARAFSAATGAWRFIFNRSVSNTTFYHFISGMDDIPGSLKKVVTSSLILMISACILGFCAYLLSRINSAKWLTAGYIAGITAITLLLLTTFDSIPWHDLPRSLPVLLTAILLIQLTTRVKATQSTEQTISWITLTTLSVFGLVLLLKIILFARVYHYGFVLAMPGTLAVVCFLLAALPDKHLPRSIPRLLFKTATSICLILFIAGHLKPALANHLKKTMTIEAGPNRFLSDSRGRYLKLILDTVNNHLQPDETLSVLPQGAAINFLTGHRTSVPHLVFMPTELAMYGELNIIADYQQSPPDYILLRDRSTAEHGVEFGESYGLDLVHWIQSHYTPARQLIPAPAPGKFGVVLLKRSPGAISGDHSQ